MRVAGAFRLCMHAQHGRQGTLCGPCASAFAASHDRASWCVRQGARLSLLCEPEVYMQGLSNVGGPAQ